MATYEGMGPCELPEYQAAFESRLQFHQLMTGELYVARFAFEEHPKAYRILGRVGLLTGNNGGVGSLEFQLVSDDLTDLDVDHRAIMRDGLLNIENHIICQPTSDDEPDQLRDACIGMYDEEHDFDAWLREAVADAKPKIT